MSMTPEASRYFSHIAGAWDAVRAGYFSDEVRDAAIAKAYLHPEMVVADVGAGTGFISAGLASSVRMVHVIDGSWEMLEEAHKNLQDFNNVEFHQADGLSIPLPDASMDAVFANMYLHHCPDPLKAIREMMRLLRPGGRLVITDLDAHPYEWMKTEMADVWQGFERSQVRAWFREAGLVNVIVDCTGQNCCANANDTAELPADERLAEISVFVAVGASRLSGVRDAVQEHYGSLAENSSSCCTSGKESTDCCGVQMISLESVGEELFSKGYTIEQRTSVPSEAADFALGCGNPVAIANLHPGETVLDIGSGGGLDVFLAAKHVGPDGFVIGVDMTPEMLARARRLAEKSGLKNVEFRQGRAEELPVADGTVDAILSNCVINLCEDKGAVFQEAGRALKPGGRLEISDMVTDRSFPAEYQTDPKNWGGCIYGALPEAEYANLISQAGFDEIKIRRSDQAGFVSGVKVYSLTVSARKS